VGKSELAKALAQELFDDEKHMVSGRAPGATRTTRTLTSPRLCPVSLSPPLGPFGLCRCAST
jgi:hypothetical protein